MKSLISSGLVALLLVGLVGLASCGDDDNTVHPLDGGGGDGPALESFTATVRRTTAGVPHVTAANLGGAGYGYGYAFAEDNLCILAEEILTVRGERAKYFGDVPYDLGQTSSKSNVSSDAVYRMLATKEIADKSRAALDADGQSLVRGFAAGVSRYVRELKGGDHAGRHASCANEAWAREITDEDLYLRFYKLALLASSATFIDAIAAAHPVSADIRAPLAPGRYAHPVSPSRISEGLEAIAPKFTALRRGEFGSNMYAFGSEVTGGAGIQFGNPHFPWYGGERLYQVHLTVPGKMDVQGASLYGVPAVLIGFTDTFAWSHTVSSAYRFTPYGLTLKAGDPFTYVQDGTEKKITPVDLAIEVKGADAPTTVRLYRSEYGPMLYLGDSTFDWTATRAFTIRDANAENLRMVKQFLRWNMAKDLAEFKRIHAEEVGTPWVNTTATDKNGDVYYGDLTVVPNVPDELADSCQIPILSKALAQSAVGLPLLDGSKKACDWKIDADAPQPGAFGASHLPTVERKDWVVNCNDSYWLTNTKAPLTGFARIIGRQAYEQSLRSRLCHQQVLDRVAGADGLPGTTFTIDDVKQIVLGARVFTAERFKTPILDAVCTTPSIALTHDPLTNTDVSATVATGPACAALRAWENRTNADSRGSLVWDELWFRITAMRSAGKASYKVPFDAADPINTPRDLTALPDDLAQAFAAAVNAVTTNGFAVDAPRSSFSFRAGKGGVSDRIPVPGGFQSVGNFTIAQTNAAPSLKPDVGYGPLDDGNSFIQVVGFGPNGVDASTFVTYSESTDPASDHYDDYTRLYSQKAWLKAAFSEAEVAADTKSTMALTQ